MQSNVVPFPAMLEQFKGEIARALPKHLSPDRMVRIALTAFRMNPKLAQTDPRSVFAAVIQSSQLGLEVGLMGEAHLVPFGNQCQLIPGYQGLMKLARNSGIVQDIYGHEVRINDKFDIVLGLNRTLMHEPLKKNGFPASDEERGVIVGFYAVAVFKDGTRTFHALSKEQIEQVRDNSRGYQMAKKYGKESPWDTHFVPMGLKTVIRRLCNLLPKSPELAMALALDEVTERGETQNIGITEAIDGSWAPIIDEETGEVIPTATEPVTRGTSLTRLSHQAASVKLPASCCRTPWPPSARQHRPTNWMKSMSGPKAHSRVASWNSCSVPTVVARLPWPIRLPRQVTFSGRKANDHAG